MDVDFLFAFTLDGVLEFAIDISQFTFQKRFTFAKTFSCYRRPLHIPREISEPLHKLSHTQPHNLAPFAAKRSSFHRRQTVNDFTGPPPRSLSPSFALPKTTSSLSLTFARIPSSQPRFPHALHGFSNFPDWSTANRFTGTLPFSQAHLSSIRNVELYG